MPTKFLQVHLLTSYPASLLNRDDAGFAKRIPFGGATRTRISSQCLKRHWRTYEGTNSLQELDLPQTIRSRLTFERFVVQPLLSENLSEPVVRSVVAALMAELLGKSPKVRATEDTDAHAEGELRTEQVTILGRPEVEYLVQLAREICRLEPAPDKTAAVVKEHLGRSGRENLKTMRLGSGLDAALFGRMVTSDILARGDGAVHVAHAFTVHEEYSESDYFAAVDDLLGAGGAEELGSGHIGTAELTSGLFYTYLVADIPLLVSNLEGCERRDWQNANRGLAGRVVEKLIQIASTVSPGAKLGSTAPYAYAHAVLAEMGDAQPRTLANAFVRPVVARPDLIANAYAALGEHVRDLDAMYGREGITRRIAGIGAVKRLAEDVGADSPMSLPQLAAWAAAQVQG